MDNLSQPIVLSQPEVKQEIILPRKKNNTKKIFGAIFALLLVVGISIGSFYFTRNLDQAAVPTAPTSQPEAKWKSAKYYEKSWEDVGDPNTRQAQRYAETGAYNDQQATTLKTTADKINADSGKVNGVYIEKGTKYVKTDSGTYQLRPDGNLVYQNGGYRADEIDAIRFAMASDTGGKLKDDSPLGLCTSGARSCDDQQMIKGIDGYDSSNPQFISGVYLKGDKYFPIGPVVEETGGKGGSGGGTVAKCTVTSWTPNVNTVCAGTKFTQTSNCKGTRQATGTRDCTCETTSWTPDASDVCKDKDFIQTSNCDETRDAVGKKTDGTCCVATTWTPNANTICVGSKATQTSNCETTKEVDGTKVCMIELTSTKKAFRDESSNTPGSYRLRTEIDKVSKNQIFVYAFEITNGGNAKAENVTVIDELIGDNQELLSYVGGDTGCKYASSTRTVTCSGKNVEPSKKITYAFRVRVAGDAANGEVIKNVGIISYKGMPEGSETEASVELTVSTVVGCNQSCNSDDECSSGLTCDLESNKCRKPSCTEEVGCVCPRAVVVVEGTRAPVRVATARPEPTVLPETGILDFPGAAALGGGLLMAIVGILLAL